MSAHVIAEWFVALTATAAAACALWAAWSLSRSAGRWVVLAVAAWGIAYVVALCVMLVAQ